LHASCLAPSCSMVQNQLLLICKGPTRQTRVLGFRFQDSRTFLGGPRSRRTRGLLIVVAAVSLRASRTPSLISVLGLIDDAGDMMVDGVNFPLPPAAAVRPLGLSGLANTEEELSSWQQENSGSRPQQVIDERRGVLLLRARMREPLTPSPHR
jgi:hypothetical protein